MCFSVGFFFVITFEGNLFRFSMDSSSITFDLMYCIKVMVVI